MERITNINFPKRERKKREIASKCQCQQTTDFVHFSAFFMQRATKKKMNEKHSTMRIMVENECKIAAFHSRLWC